MATKASGASSNYATRMIAAVWSKDLWYALRKELFFQKFMGTGVDSVIQVKEDLTKKKGDTIYFGIPKLLPFVTDGTVVVSGDNTLWGSEQTMEYWDFAVTVDQKRMAVKQKGELSNQQVAYNMRVGARDMLKIQLAEWLDFYMMHKLYGLTYNPELTGMAAYNLLANSPQYDNTCLDRFSYKYDDGRSTDATGGAAFTLEHLSWAKYKAQAQNLRRPKMGGRPVLVGIISPQQAYACRTATGALKFEDVMKYAGPKGFLNPLFTGAEFTFDSVVVHVHENIARFPAESDGTSNFDSVALILGCQAGVRAIAKRAFWKEKLWDYDDELRVATGLIFNDAKVRFQAPGGDTTADDYSIIGIQTKSDEPTV